MDSHAMALGRPGKPSEISRRIDVDMSDAMDFSPSAIEVIEGETIEFVVRNEGSLRHEFVLGDEQQLLEHQNMMSQMPEAMHDEANQVRLESGESGRVVWTFNEAGTVTFACLEPGHYEAGMKGTVVIATARSERVPSRSRVFGEHMR